MSVRALRDLGAHHAAPLLQDRGANETHLSLRSAISLGAEAVFNGVRTHAPPEQISLASHPNMPIDLVNKSNLMPRQKWDSVISALQHVRKL